jgi:methyl-accepting chemotaxis protein
VFKNLTIGKKIGLGFSIVLAALGVIVAISFVGVGGIVGNAEQVIYGNSLDANMTQKEVDHLNWANKVSALLTDDKITKLEVQTDDHKCGFGKWLYGDARKDAEASVPGLADILKQIEGHHSDLHGSAVEIGKQFHQADASLPQFLTEKEVDHLKWASKCKNLFLQNLDKLVITTDDHKCGLGKFLYGETGKTASASDPQLAGLIEAITKPHAKLHASAIEIQKTWKQPHPGLVDVLRMRLDDHRKWAGAVSRAR